MKKHKEREVKQILDMHHIVASYSNIDVHRTDEGYVGITKGAKPKIVLRADGIGEATNKAASWDKKRSGNGRVIRLATEPDLKPGELNGLVGSTPTPSANNKEK